MRTRTRIHPYLIRDVARRLDAYCGAKGLTESAAVQAAIEQYLDGGERDGALILRRLDRQAQVSARVQRDVEVLSEAFAVFVRIWVLYMPNYSDAELAAARPLATSRFDDFIGTVSRRVAAGSRLTSKVLKDGTSGAGSPGPKAAATPPASTGR